MSIPTKITSAISFAFALVANAPAFAADNSLLGNNDRQQLAAWLGSEPVSLTNIFTKQSGNTAADFHAAVDGKGRTVVIMEATTRSGATYLLGGYNPQSWASSGGYALTPDDGQRTAFLFNLTTDRIYRQMLNVRNLEAVGAYQTLNETGVGPTFGSGHDLQMSDDLTRGYSLLYSYADSSLSDMYLSIADGQTFKGINDLAFGRVEVYSISAVPEPAAFALLAGGLCVLLAKRNRKR